MARKKISREEAAEKKEARRLALERIEASRVYDEADPKDAKKIKRDKAGRPTVMTKLVLAKLEEAYKIGCPHREAAFWAGISESTLMRYKAADEDFDSIVEAWREENSIEARRNISTAIKTNHSLEDSWMYLRAHKKQEFAEQKNLSVNANVVSIAELEQAAEEGVVPNE